MITPPSSLRQIFRYVIGRQRVDYTNYVDDDGNVVDTDAHVMVARPWGWSSKLPWAEDGGLFLAFCRLHIALFWHLPLWLLFLPKRLVRRLASRFTP